MDTFLSVVHQRSRDALGTDCSSCRAIATERERAVIDPCELTGWIEHSTQKQPSLSLDDATNRALRNVPRDDARWSEVFAEHAESAAPPLPPLPDCGAPPPPFISVLSPTTFTRHWAHETLYRCFASQVGAPERELLVLDDGGIKSPFFTSLRDRRVRYFHVPMLPRGVRSVGAKRNWLAQKARGVIIAAFDDDDVYQEQYLARMAHALLTERAALVKLASWVSYDAATDALSRYDDEADVGWGHHARRWGYGFSYVYTRELAAACPFPDLDHGEDYALIMDAAARGFRLIAYADQATTACCAHTSHGLNTSGVPSSARACASDCAFARPGPLREMLAAAREHRRALEEAMSLAAAAK